MEIPPLPRLYLRAIRIAPCPRRRFAVHVLLVGKIYYFLLIVVFSSLHSFAFAASSNLDKQPYTIKGNKKIG